MPHAGVSDSNSPGSDSLLRFANKTVPFRFLGRDMAFRLSHALFSSYDIDDGTRLLLKSIAKHVDLDGVLNALDVGCGVGVIGACIRARAPRAAVLLQDRDALAVEFARENCRANDVGDVTVETGLAFWHLGGKAFDFVTSNLPAKAGTPVLQSFLRHAAGCLSLNGIAAVVIVDPLAGLALDTLTTLGCGIAYKEAARNYTVLHFQAGNARQESDDQRQDMAPYIRARSAFSHEGTAYKLETAFSLPDFDSVSHSLELCLDALVDVDVAGNVLVWNPGQGHLPSFLLSRYGPAITGISLASRDALELAITEKNILAMGRRPQDSLPVPSEKDLALTYPKNAFDFICMTPHPIPRVPWQADAIASAHALLRSGGRVLLAGASTEMHRLLAQRQGFRLLADRKRAGFR
jgi:SAM-dependent methyltransferase